ncbi:MAG: molybdopterin-synthase adenylyltransferase MoeB [Gemmatimonadetes bacterium]|nr:molybdopterin-synthase adenylyltransferase MoeB [Gemmatimonadota bacterium]
MSTPPELPADLAPFSREELIRYARHLALSDVGPVGQRKLRDARVVIIGAGGLGSPVSLYLAAAGVGTLGIVDYDEVDLTNLQRQVLHGSDDVGRSKIASAIDRIHAINPHVQIKPHELRLTSENAIQILERYDVIVDGTDNFPTRYLMNDASVMLGKPNVYGSIYRWEGQVSVFGAEGGPCYRCLFREPPPPGLVPSCAEGGVMGALPGVIGSLQAIETLKLILGSRGSLAGRLVIFDALEMHWRELTLKRNPECPVCGDNPTVTELIDYEDFCGMRVGEEAGARAGVPVLTPPELDRRVQESRSPFLLDVREPYEWFIGNLETLGAVQIPLGQLSMRIADLPRDREIVVFCRVGLRGADAVEELLAEGFSDVYNLEGGILAWAEQVDPSVTRY